MKILINSFLEEAKNLQENVLNHEPNRAYVPNVQDLKLAILKEMHNVPYVGHLGYQNTVAAVKSHYFWPGMKK